MNLSQSKEHYIKAIHILSSGNHGVPITKIAEKLKVTKASVCIAMNALQKDDYIFRGAHRKVFLTEKGKAYATELTERYAIIKHFLLTTLHVNNEIAEQEACALEHVVSAEIVSCMQSVVNSGRYESKSNKQSYI